MRDENIIALRPQLDLDVSNADKMEQFQNQTLRPLLKLQNSVSHHLLHSSKHFKSMLAKIDTSNRNAYEEAVKKYVTSNIAFKNRLLGFIIGMMTEAELEFYSSESSEIHKRITTMQIKRYVDNAFA